jgi:aspartyl-tRNA(Asn)/glutamyl-tRNA(Gln) amidotransferase subunit A
VRDAALMFGAMARHDLRDPYSLPDDPRDWLTGIEDGVAGLRVAVVRRMGFAPPLDAEGEEVLAAAARLLEEQGAIVEEADPGLPDTRAIFGRVWGVALSRIIATTPEDKRELLDAGIAEVAAREGEMLAVDYLAAEAMRLEAAHAMARFHQRYDLVLTACTPTAAFAADQPTIRPAEALWRDWAPWTFAFNLTRQPAISVPVALDAEGMPRAVQIVAALYRDDLALRISVQPGGCAGLRYNLFFDDRELDGDLTADFGGVALTIDRMSAPYVQGAIIDFVDTIEKQGFTIDNPNATGSCACGDSFN